VVATAVGEEPEPSRAELVKALQQLHDQFVDAAAEIRKLLGLPDRFTGPPLPLEKLPDGLDELPPMRGFMVDEDDGK
jgi:hypothetical protein